MGYYTGNGETTGGGSSVSVLERFVWYGGHVVWQRSTTSTNRKGGVSLATAEAARGTCSLSDKNFTWVSGNVSCSHMALGCKGSRSDVSWSQISGSNLYELVTTNEHLEVKFDNGGWE